MTSTLNLKFVFLQLQGSHCCNTHSELALVGHILIGLPDGYSIVVTERVRKGLTSHSTLYSPFQGPFL